MQTNEISFVPNAGGVSQKIVLTSGSAQSTAFGVAANLTTNNPGTVSPIYVNLMVDALAFIRQGVNPTALSNGTDQVVPANQLFRIGPITPGNKLALILPSGTGNAYITPED